MVRKPQRWRPILAVASLALFIVLLYNTNFSRETWKRFPQHFGLGEYSMSLNDSQIITNPNFTAGVVKPPGEGYTRKLIIASIKKDDLGWMAEEIPDVDKLIYVADDPYAPLHPPTNKGHEVMVYLTYILDNYDDLPDVMMFMHAHRYTWHNNDVLNHDAAEMIRRLSSERVTREGFMNMRCHWMPGCPAWMHPGTLELDRHRPEEVEIARSWAELFPGMEVPDSLGAACCSQLALSRQRVRSIPRETYEHYKNWMMNTPLPDFMSGRVWEYMWQYVFTGETTHCPIEHVCYCDGFGVCFGGQSKYNEWFGVRGEKEKVERELAAWEEKEKEIAKAIADKLSPEAIAKLEVPQPGLNETLKARIQEFEGELVRRTNEAIERGNSPQNRAFEAGRPWQEGDGF